MTCDLDDCAPIWFENENCESILPFEEKRTQSYPTMGTKYLYLDNLKTGQVKQN